MLGKNQQKQIPGTGSEGGRRPTGDPVPGNTEVSVDDSKSNTKKRRTATYKLSVLETVEQLKKENPHGIGEYLRSEGLYSKTIERWQIDKDKGLLSEYRKGTIGQIRESMGAENAQLKRQLAATEKKLKQAEILIELQKKISQLSLVDIPLKDNENYVED